MIRPVPVALTLAAFAAAGVLAAGTDGTMSGWSSAKLANGTDTAGAAALAVSHVYPGGSCAAAPRVTTAPCPGGLAPTAGPDGTGVPDTITNTGTTTSGATTEQVRGASCGPQQLVNTSRYNADDPMLPRYATTFGASDPWGGSDAISLDGSTAYASDTNYANVPLSNGGTFTGGVWFQAPKGSPGGGLLSLSGGTSDPAGPTDQNGSGSSAMIWLDAGGHLDAGVADTSGSAETVATTSGTYTNGSWHFVVAQMTYNVSRGTGRATVTIYVDGKSVKSASRTSSGVALTGFAHLGWADFSGWSPAPASAHLGGSLAGAYFDEASESGAEISTLSNEPTAAAYETELRSLNGVADIWMLGDAGTSTFSGNLPALGSTSPCTELNLGWTVSPAGTFVLSGTSLSAFANNTWRSSGTVHGPAPSAAQTATLSTSYSSGCYAACQTYVAGLRLYVPLSVRAVVGPWQLELDWTSPQSVFMS